METINLFTDEQLKNKIRSQAHKTQEIASKMIEFVEGLPESTKVTPNELNTLLTAPEVVYQKRLDAMTVPPQFAMIKREKFFELIGLPAVDELLKLHVALQPASELRNQNLSTIHFAQCLKLENGSLTIDNQKLDFLLTRAENVLVEGHPHFQDVKALQELIGALNKFTPQFRQQILQNAANFVDVQNNNVVFDGKKTSIQLSAISNR